MFVPIWQALEKTWLAETPCRCATAETAAPASSVSAMIAAFCSSLQRRRRPTPVITSIRRNVSDSNGGFVIGV